MSVLDRYSKIMTVAEQRGIALTKDQVLLLVLAETIENSVGELLRSAGDIVDSIDDLEMS